MTQLSTKVCAHYEKHFFLRVILLYFPMFLFVLHVYKRRSVKLCATTAQVGPCRRTTDLFLINNLRVTEGFISFFMETDNIFKVWEEVAMLKCIRSKAISPVDYS